MRVRYALAALTLFTTALSVRGAVTSNLTEVGSTIQLGQHVVQDFNKRDMSPASHVALSSDGDDAISTLNLSGSEGRMTLHTHACSGPPLFSNAGQAGASGDLSYFEDFRIVSATLPAGTPVTINVKIAAGSSFVAVRTIPLNFNDYSSISGHTGIRIDTLSTTDYTISGDFAGSGGDPPFRSQSGLFASSPPTGQGDRRAGEFTAVIGGLVGGKFHFNIQSQLSALSGAGNPRISDASGEISILWGADVVGGLATILANSDNLPFPGTSNATADRALFYLPQGIPEPTGLALILPGLLFLWRARQSR
ncbi:hypothetical protein BH09PLA1_BH09PLA1_25750 [soil metagenome]